MNTTDKLIQKYLNFGGLRGYLEFLDFQAEIKQAIAATKFGTRDNACLAYIDYKINKGLTICIMRGGRAEFEIADTLEDIERGYKAPAAPPKNKSKSPAKKKPKGKDELGKIVDSGKVAPQGKADVYWKGRIELIFKPDSEKVRKGDQLPKAYNFTDMRYLENYYKLRAFEFGNWLSQQDRLNYLSGLGIALFDIHKAINMPPDKFGLSGRLGIAFGARGYGGTKAHFAPHSFTINLNRYSRPPKVKSRKDNFNRLDLLIQGGGIGSFVHEYGHALDYYGGLQVERGDTLALSRDEVINPNPKKELLNENSLRGLMERLLFKIIWKNNKEHSAYYQRLSKATKKKYYFQRNELFARAFEVYVSYKFHKQNHYNVFCSKLKYTKGIYLDFSEMKKLESDFDGLINALKKHL